MRRHTEERFISALLQKGEAREALTLNANARDWQ